MRKAFTLIELLVVIAIIAILAAILFPVFSQAKAAAKKTQALSNTKQLSTSYALYLNDSDDTYYEGAQGFADPGQLGPNATSLIWNGYLEPYKKSVALAIDPASNVTPPSSYNGVKYTGMFWTLVDRKPLSVGYNGNFTSQFGYACYLYTGPWGGPCTAMYNESQLTYESQQLLFVSSASRNPGDTGAGYLALSYHNINADGGISDRHNGFSTVSFCDTHAKAINSKSLLVKDQVDAFNPSFTGQCVNYDAGKVYWDPSAPNPTDQPVCEGQGIR